MKTNHFLSLLFLPLVFFFAACGSDDDNLDTVPPSINVIDPHDHDAFHPGDEIHVEINFADNVELANFKIDIHYDGDGHDHFSGEGEPWDYEYEGALSGTSYTYHGHIDIPEMVNGQPIAEGHYHFGVFCTDAAGNETVVWLEIEIEDEHDHEDAQDQ